MLNVYIAVKVKSDYPNRYRLCGIATADRLNMRALQDIKLVRIDDFFGWSDVITIDNNSNIYNEFSKLIKEEHMKVISKFQI